MKPARSPWPFRVLYALGVWCALTTTIVDVIAHAWLGLAAAVTLLALGGAWLAIMWERYELPAWLEGWELRWPICRPTPGIICAPTPEQRAEFERAWLRGGWGQPVVFGPYPDLAPGEGGEADERRRFP
jgi:hypothetical protein